MKRFLLFPLLLSAAIVAAQKPDDPPTFSESAGAEYVMLPVLVMDKTGRFADGLRKEDFVLKVGQTRVDVDTFDRDEGAPVSFAFLLDTSGSMGVGNKLENAKNAIRSIIRTGRPGDDFALFAFSEGDVRLVSDFSADSGKLVRALWDLEASGQTALFDAVAATPEKMMKGRNNKRAILLFTDGVDNASQLSATQMAEILQHVSVPVYTVGMKDRAFDSLNEKSGRDLSVDTLQMLAGSSGGRMHLVSGDEDLRPLGSRQRDRVRHRALGPRARSDCLLRQRPPRTLAARLETTRGRTPDDDARGGDPEGGGEPGAGDFEKKRGVVEAALVAARGRDQAPPVRHAETKSARCR